MKVFDGHCDTISRAWYTGTGIRRTDGHLDLERMHTCGQWAQFFALFMVKDRAEKPMWDIFQEQYQVFQREMAANADLVVQCRTAEDIENAWAAGKSAALLSVEGAELLECGLEHLEEAHELGARAVNLTWNFENAFSGSNAQGSGHGLTAAGKDFVRRMGELGMLVDVSHLSDPGFWDVAELGAGPIFASHSNARAVCGHRRNLTDEQFVALVKSGGVAGLNLCDEFVGEEPTVDDLIAHIEHWFSLGGEENVSLGGDWDGIEKMPQGMTDIRDVEGLAQRLLRMNYPEDRVNGLLYGNLLRVVRAVCR